MPLYEYKCKQCKRHTEKIQKFSDPEITKCPHCGGPLERVVSAPAISFKGGGWYADGYSHKKSEAKSNSSSESSVSSDAAAKPAAAASSESSSTPSSSEAAAPATAAPPSSAPSSEK